MIMLSMELLYYASVRSYLFFFSFKDSCSEVDILKHSKFETLMFPILNYCLVIKNKINFEDFNVFQL